MSNAYYKLYRDDVIAMVRTLVIKCSGAAEAINRELRMLGNTISEDPTTWKYYQNLAGEYHVTDETMTVRSMDTLEEIAFTRENLQIHRATYREYQPGSRYYNTLTRRYPSQIALIRGILAPVDKQTAIDAKDGVLLYYDPSFVESNETNLINQIQGWLYGFFSRWYNRQYAITDDLYVAAFIGVMTARLPSVILNARLRNANTEFAHSFHIREYLASNGRLDEYLPYLNKSQQLFLYRNIRYINRNVGKQDTFDWLVKHLLTDRGLPLAWYKLAHNVDEMPDSIYPSVELNKYPVNFGFNQSGIDTVTTHTILEKERPMARENAAVQDASEKEINTVTRSSAFSELPTKVLESEVVDRSNSSIRSLASVLLNEWIHLAAEDRYRAFITVPNPGTGQFMSMSVRDALVVSLYAFCKPRGIELNTIPHVPAFEVLRSPLPTREELLSLTDTRYVSNHLVDAVRDRITPLGDYISTEGFNTAVTQLHREYLKLWELYSLQPHYLSRSMAENVVRRHFMHKECVLVDDDIGVEQWLAEKGYDITTLGALDLNQLYINCVSTATGSDLTSQLTLKQIQRAMLDIMGKLSSYSVQYLRTINAEDFWFVGWSAIRMGDISASATANVRAYRSRLTVHRMAGTTRVHLDATRLGSMTPMRWSARTHAHFKVRVPVQVRHKITRAGRMRLDITGVGIQRVEINTDSTPPSDNDLGHYSPSSGV